MLDNFQDGPAGSPLTELLPLTVEEIPEGIRLIVVSRTGPAANMSRLATNLMFCILGEQGLRLSREETRVLAANYQRPSDQRHVLSAEALYAATNGWVAGVTMTLRHDAATAGDAASPTAALHADGVQLSLDRGVRPAVRGRTRPIDQDFLPGARRGAGRRRHLRSEPRARNTGRAGQSERLHDLSSGVGYLSLSLAVPRLPPHRLDATLGREEQRALRTAAAQSLVHAHDAEPAIALLLQADWPGATALIRATAPAMAQQARFQTLIGWLAQLPAPVVQDNGWLC